MERHRLAWALSLPLAAAGWLTAHSLAYRLVGPHHELEHDAVHGYLVTVQPAAFAAAAAAMLACIAVGVHRTRFERPPLPFFAIVPFGGFAVQEQCEHVFHRGDLTIASALEPTFLLGLALQVPFALAALALARALFELGGVLGRVLSSRPAPRLSLSPSIRRATTDAELPRFAALALGYGERGPPALSAAT